MKCLRPIFLDTDEIDIYPSGKLPIPCGKCEACRNDDSNQWRIRLKEHFYSSVNAIFITLTYNDDTLHFEQFTADNGRTIWHETFNKSDVQKFFKRFRKKFESYYKKQDEKFSYFLVSEYGPTYFRPHYHALLFNVPILSDIPEVQNFKITEEVYNLWGKGFVKVDACNEARICYCTKYMSCVTQIPSYLPKPFRLISKGIGKSYILNSRLMKWHKEALNCYYQDGQFKLKLPKYYKDKIFDEDEKQLIRQLYFIKQEDNPEKVFHYSFEPGAIRDLKDKQEKIKAFKRIYYKKSLKTRKDL